MVHRSRFSFKPLVVLTLLLILLVLTRAWWLSAMGRVLVHDDGPAKAEVIVVLGGDFYGNRVVKAAQLVQSGYAPVVWLSGAPGFYGLNECDLALPFIQRKGYPAAWFVPLRNGAHSTGEEAGMLLRELQRAHIRSFLLVTSDFHTARASRIFRGWQRQLGYHPTMRVVAAPDENFRADSWWRSREGQKVAFGEWMKTVANVLGI